MFNQDDRQRVNGFTIGSLGQITSRWQVLASFGYLNTRQISQNAANDGKRLTLTPEFSGSFWSTYDFPRGLTIGGGIRYMDEVFVNAANTIRVPGYALADAMVEYDVNTHLSLRLNINNLTDEVYIKNVNNNGGRFNPGTPRSATRDVERALSEAYAMLLTIPDLLSADQVAAARELLEHAEWVDGRVTAGPQSARAKRNQQLPEGSAAAEALGDMILTALQRNPLFVSAALPLRVFPPLFNRYEGGQAFGNHIDNAIRQIAGTGHRIRTDLSATLFLADPDEYDGGELVVEDNYGVHKVKLPAGDMVLYPGVESPQRDAGHQRRPRRVVLLDPKHDSRRRPPHAACSTSTWRSSNSRAMWQRTRPSCNSQACTTTCFGSGRRCRHHATAFDSVLAAPSTRRCRGRGDSDHVGHRRAADLSAANHSVGRHARLSRRAGRTAPVGRCADRESGRSRVPT